MTALMTALVAVGTLPELHGQSPADTALTADQQEQFAAARKDFAAEHWADALARLKPLHQARPADANLTKFTAESAINTGDTTYAIDLLKPIRAESPDDWQARSILVHAYAQAHQESARDAELRDLTALHRGTADPAFQKVLQVVTERVPLNNGGAAVLYYSLQPWSRYNIQQMARVYDAKGQQIQRVTLESSDADQALWADSHKKQAAAGMRVFTIDGYTEQTSASGQKSQTHSTYGFLDGQPTYDAFRDRVVSIAQGKASASSSTSGLTTPQP